MTYLPAGFAVPAPARDGLDQPYWDAAARHRLAIQRCPACGTFQFGPEWLCHSCLRFDPEWVETASTGSVFSWTRVHHPVHRALRDSVPYVVVIVELADAGGVRVVGNLLGDPHQAVFCGMAVDAAFEDHHDPEYTLVQWKART